MRLIAHILIIAFLGWSLANSFGEASLIIIKRPEGNSVKINGIAKFDGERWIKIGDEKNSLEGKINDMVCLNKILYLIGDFYLPSEPSQKHMAYWDDDKWHSIETPDNETPESLVAFQNELYLLASAEPKECNYGLSRLYCWHENKWQRVEVPVKGAVFSKPLATHEKLIWRTWVSDTFRAEFFCWDGQKLSRMTAWNSLQDPGGEGAGFVSWVLENNNKTYVGGNFVIGAYDHPIAKNVACYDGSNWSPLRDGNKYCANDGAVISGYLYSGFSRWSFEKLEWESLGSDFDSGWHEWGWPRSITSSQSQRYILCDYNLLVGDGKTFTALPYTASDKLAANKFTKNHQNTIDAIICADSNSLYLAGVNSVFQPFSKKELEQRAVEEKARKAAADDLKKQQEAEDLKKTLALQAEADRVAAEKEKDGDIKLHQIPPTLHSAGEPSYLDTVTYINNCLKQSGKFLYFDPKRNKVVVTYAHDCSAIFDLADFDPKATEYTTKTVKIYCTDRKAKVSYACGGNTINTS